MVVADVAVESEVDGVWYVLVDVVFVVVDVVLLVLLS